MLSTIRAGLAQRHAKQDHKRMVDPAFNFETVLSRLEHVREKTLCPSKAALAAWLEAGSPQTVQQWESRDSLPGRAALSISERTGADVTWLLSGKGEPFPNGPTIYVSPAVPPSVATELATEIQALWALVGSIGQALARTAPETAEEVLRQAMAAQAATGPSRFAGKLVQELRTVLQSPGATLSKKPQSRTSTR